MSTEVEPAVYRNGLLTRAHRLFEIPALFDVYQVLVDGGKHAPVSGFLREVPYETVLDLGCGTGAWSYLTRTRYLGIDFSPSFVAGCRRRFANDPRKSFEVGDVESIAVDERYDLALMMSVLHHISDAQARRLLDRLSKCASRVVVMDLMPNPGNPISRLLYRLDRGDFIRSTDAQRRLLLESADWKLEREDAFYSYNRIYRHTLFLLCSPSPRTTASVTDPIRTYAH